MKMNTVLAVAVIAVSGHAASASPFSDPYTSFWALGDSLTDDGNLFAAAGVPGAPYFAGRVSSGPTYAEYLAADFTAQGKPADNLAYAGATAVTNGDSIPDLQLQAFAPVPIYADLQGGLVTRAGAFGARPLVSLFFGSNDVLGALGRGEDPGAAAVAAAGAVLGSIAGLNTAVGVRDFLVLGLPDFALTPRLNGLPAPIRAIASDAARSFDAAIAAGLGGLPDGIAVTQVDVFTTLRDLLGDPDPLGITNTTEACLTFGVDADGNRTIDSICADASAYAFFDDIHPTAAVHVALADTVRMTVAPVPLPAAGWALLAGLGGLAAVARRHAA